MHTHNQKDVANFSDLSYATIILSNVILKTEEIYLVNHIKLYLKNHPTTVEKLKRKQHQRQRQQLQLQQMMQPQQLKQTTNNSSSSSSAWLLDVNHDKPSTSSAAAAALAAASALSSGSSYSAVNSPTSSANSSSCGGGSGSGSGGGGLNEYNYFPTVLCDILFESLQTLADQRRSSKSYSHQFSSQYCRLVCNFVKVLNKLCSNTRLDDFLLVSIRSILNVCESKLLNEYYNLLMMYSTQGCPNTSYSATATSSSTTAAMAAANTSSVGTASTTFTAGGIGTNTSSLGLEQATADDNVVLQLQLEMFQLLNSIGVLDTVTLLQRLQSNDISNHVRRALLNKVCHQSVVSVCRWV